MKVFVIGGRKAPQYVKYNTLVAKAVSNFGVSVDYSQIEAKRESDVENFDFAFKRNIQSIKKADIVIVEASELSSGIGFLIGAALNEKKPVLALFNSESEGKPSITLKGGASSSKLFTFKEYSEATLNRILKEYMDRIKKILDTKFILIISPEIDRYLQWASDNRRMHKAQVVRLALEEVMDKDKEYKTFLKSSK